MLSAEVLIGMLRVNFKPAEFNYQQTTFQNIIFLFFLICLSK